VHAPPIVEELLLGLFRFRTRGFLRMEECAGAAPARPQSGACYLYVHIPFCEALCPFCSFHRVQHCPEQAARYFTALRRELTLSHEAGFTFTGVYFGGGTPTVEPAELLATIAQVRAQFGVREVSVETNPRDLRPDLLAALRTAGVTRLSVGVQSFDDPLLHEMGRLERYGSGAETAERIRAAAGLFPTLNVDLIFNQPHQTAASLARDLEIFQTLGANQVSCYPLMSSPDARHRMAGAMGVPNRRRLRPLYETISRTLEGKFTPTSAWCFTRGGTGSDEYIATADNYVGAGSGAFSYLDGTLYATTFSLPAYERRIAAGQTGIATRHALGATDRMRYALLVRMFGLGLDRAWAQAHHGDAFFRRLWGELRTLELLGAARRDDAGWRLTASGRYWLMLMMAECFSAVNAYRDAMRTRAAEENAAISAMPLSQPVRTTRQVMHSPSGPVSVINSMPRIILPHS
jgi:coproporphyrinogen III oxidase-like Fe-S oxidoreductase